MPTVPNLRPIREQAALSQRELAALAGVGSATVARLERGQGAYPRTIRRLAAALHVRPAALMIPPEEPAR